MLVQQWPQHYDFDIQDVVSKDPDARSEWEREVKSMKPLAVEEVTWLMDRSNDKSQDEEEEEKDEEEEEEEEGKEDEEENQSEEEEDDEENQRLASKQLLDGFE